MTLRPVLVTAGVPPRTAKLPAVPRTAGACAAVTLDSSLCVVVELSAPLLERVVAVIGRGLAASPGDRYPTVTAFAAAFSEAVADSAEELASCAWEAISAGTPELGIFYADAAERYDPHSRSLSLLRMQLGGAATAVMDIGRRPDSPRTLLSTEGGVRSTLAGRPGSVVGLDPALTVGVPEEMLKLIAPPLSPVERPRTNPWLLFVAGSVVLTLLLFVGLAAVTFSGST
jgi:hypothetical protein